MPGHHALARTTHTLELQQVQELSLQLSRPHTLDRVTASALHLAGQPVSVEREAWYRELLHLDEPASQQLPPGAVLVHVWAEGSPDYPYVWGQFHTVTLDGRTPSGPALATVLHTEALRRLSRAMGLHHRWGLDAPQQAP